MAKLGLWRSWGIVCLCLMRQGDCLQKPLPDPGTLIEDTTLISPERSGPLRHAYVLIQDGRIKAVGKKLTVVDPGVRKINARGKFLIPGLIDSHVHIGHSAALDDDAIDAKPGLWTAYKAQVPRAYLAFGFTTIVDLDLKPSDAKWFQSAPLHPRLYHCGKGIKVPGGYGAFQVKTPLSEDSPALVYGPQEAKSFPETLDRADFTAQRALDRIAESGAICVKAFVEPGFGVFSWPYIHTDTLREIETAASTHHLPLMVHATNVYSWRSAIDAHAQIIAHGLWIWPGRYDDPQVPQSAREAIAAAARDHIRVQPTLQTVGGERAFYDPSILDDLRLGLSLPKEVIAYLRSPEGVKARTSLLDRYQKMSPAPGFQPSLQGAIQRTRSTFKLMLKDKVPLIFGSDTPAGDGFGNPPGLNGRLEMQDWADAGVPLALILRAVTLDNAVALGLAHDVGSIEVGKRADMVLLNKNPLVTIGAYDSIDKVFLNGAPMNREALQPPN